MDLFEETIERVIAISEDTTLVGRLSECTHTCEGGNPSCGDHVVFTLTITDGVIVDIRFEATGCTISRAAAVVVAERLKNQPFSLLKTIDDSYIRDALGQVVRIRQGCLSLPLRVLKDNLL